jgi:hypothetical protein
VFSEQNLEAIAQNLVFLHQNYAQLWPEIHGAAADHHLILSPHHLDYDKYAADS